MRRTVLEPFHQSKLSMHFVIIKLLVGKHLLMLVFLLASSAILAQRDAIIKKDSTEIRCKIIRATTTKYKYAFINEKSEVVKGAIIKSLVDTIQYNKYDANIVTNKLFEEKPVPEVVEEEPVKSYKFTFGIGLNLGNILEFNSPSGSDKKSFSGTSALDLGLDYFKEGNRFAMTNELHWTFAVQKSQLTSAAHIQRVTDDLITLHDFSFAMSKNNNWNFNLIAKTNTSIFTIFDGDYFKDYNNGGKVQGFLNPYEITLSPGIKYQPNDYFRLSISPYSVSLYGLTSQQIANTGYYTQTFDVNNNYDLFVFKQLGAELNIWYDRKFKKWLELQYRLGFSSDYFTNIAKNGLMSGLFITKVKIIKNISITHRGVLKGDFTSKPFKPYYLQTILIGFSKTF